MPRFDKSYYVKGALLIGDNYRGQIADIDQSPPTSPNTSLAGGSKTGCGCSRNASGSSKPMWTPSLRDIDNERTRSRTGAAISYSPAATAVERPHRRCGHSIVGADQHTHDTVGGLPPTPTASSSMSWR